MIKSFSAFILFLILFAGAGWGFAFYENQQLEKTVKEQEVVIKLINTATALLDNCSNPSSESSSSESTQKQEDRILLPFNDNPLDDDGSHKELTL